MNSEKDYQNSGKILEGEEQERINKVLHISEEIKYAIERRKLNALPNEEERKYLGINT